VDVADDVAEQDERLVCSLGRPLEGEAAVVGVFLLLPVIRVLAQPLVPVQLEHHPFVHPLIQYIIIIVAKAILAWVLGILSKAVVRWDGISVVDDIHVFK
jgi:hypothetical protein